MYLKSVHFKNIKSFDNVEFQFGRDERYAGWHVFVGGNGSGKSTILKGIALAIVGPGEARVLMGETSDWLRTVSCDGSIEIEIAPDATFDKRTSKGQPQKSSFKAGVEWKRDEPNQIPSFQALKRKRVEARDKGLWDPNASGWMCAGYGPMRRLTGTSPSAIRHAVSKGVRSRLLTLFYEDAALTESEQWFKEISARAALETNGEKNYEQLKEQVRSFLNSGLLPNDLRISQATMDAVILENDGGVRLPMRDLSDGVRSVYAFTLDLIHAFYDVYGSFELFKKSENEEYWVVDKPGVVLIDEVEAHLHPKWQKTLSEWLMTRFPGVQFIVTTHSPLIVQAATPGGVYVLPLQDEGDRKPRRLTDVEADKIRFGKAEKILLGEAFGLQNTRSKWANEQIKHYQRLAAKQKQGVELSEEEKEKLGDLKGQMGLIFEPSGEE
jgi:energy-coupling factor transporter ATP-binding protein EcfA2